jgi:predicted O-methyltransferase YrrM
MSLSESVADVHQQMTEMIFGYAVSQIIRTAAEFSLADHLAAEPLTAQQIGDRESSAPATTLRLLRACAALGLVTIDDAGRFHSTALLDYLEQNPALAMEFSAGMSSGTSVWAPALAELIDTTNVRRAVDVGGANGTLLTLLQQADPALHGVLFDRPNIAKDAKAHIAQNGFAERTEVVGGDFFESVPAGDLYLLKFIPHDWDDEDCVKILRTCRKAMEPGGRIAIFELVVGDDGKDTLGALMDMNVLAVVNGRERSLQEFDALLHRAGLRRTAVLTADSPQSVIEAVAA